MRLSFLRRLNDSLRRLPATTLVGVGLVTLVASLFWPWAPIVTSVAVITLGATEITLSRFQSSTALVPVAILHGATYACLYAAFIGATLQAAGAAVGSWTALDLAASLIPMAIAMRRILSSLGRSLLSRP